MNILKPVQRRSIVRKVHLEYLDERIVPSTVAAGAEVAAAHASVSATEQNEGTATAETQVQIRRENRIIKMDERREARIEKRDARLERLAAAAAKFSPAIIVRSPSAQAASTSGSRQSAALASQSTGSSSSTSTTSGSTWVPTSPVVTPVSTSPGSGSSGSSSSGSGSSGTSSPTSNPLPDNVSGVLDTIYEEYENGDLPTTNQPGQVEIQGTSVGVQIRSSSADFDTVLANAESLGLQVTTVFDSYDMIVGFLPIAQLPAAAQLAGAPSITPVLNVALSLN